MLHKLTVPVPIHGEMRPLGYVFDVPAGRMPPGSHAQGEGGACSFRPYSAPLNDEEIEIYQAHQASLKAAAEAAAAAAHEAEIARGGDHGPGVAGKRVRLTAQAYLDGALREPGYEFFLPEGEKGPMRTVRRHHERIDVARDNLRIDAASADEPLFEDVPVPVATPTPEIRASLESIFPQGGGEQAATHDVLIVPFEQDAFRKPPVRDMASHIVGEVNCANSADDAARRVDEILKAPREAIPEGE
jgi:hypothetical protein